MSVNKNSIKVSDALKHKLNPFLDNDVITMDKGKKQIVIGSTNKVLVDTKSGDAEAITLLHKYKEVDRDKFVKLYVNEIQALFDLTKTGLKVFGFVLQCLKINDDMIYMDVSEIKEYCGYKSNKTVYKGLSELLSSKIIAMSNKTNLWFVNPKVVFNGNRIAFVKEYRLKETGNKPEQKHLEFRPEPKVDLR